MFPKMSSPFFGQIDFCYVLGSHTWLNCLIDSGASKFNVCLVKPLQCQIGFKLISTELGIKLVHDLGSLALLRAEGNGVSSHEITKVAIWSFARAIYIFQGVEVHDLAA
jgi:hypothetical protein